MPGHRGRWVPPLALAAILLWPGGRAAAQQARAPATPSIAAQSIAAPSIVAPPGVATPGAAATAVAAGHPQVLDTGSLRTGGRVLALDGIQGAAGPHAAAFQRYIDANGGTVRCQAASVGRFTCRLPSGVDVALAVLVNGSALAMPDAPEEFHRQQQAAQSARRGLWQRPIPANQPLPAENFAPRPQGPGAPPRMAQVSAGGWTYYASVYQAAGVKVCGIETAWRQDTARVTVQYVVQDGQRTFDVTVRDDGWDIPPGLAGPGTLTIDGQAWDLRFERNPASASIMTGRFDQSTGAQALLAKLSGAASLWLTTPLGRTAALGLRGSGAALAGLTGCIKRTGTD